MEVHRWRTARTLPERYPAATVSILDLMAPDATLAPARWITQSLLPERTVSVMAAHFAASPRATNELKHLIEDESDMNPDALGPGDIETRRISGRQLVSDGSLSIHRGARLSADRLGKTGVPVITEEWVRDPVGPLSDVRFDVADLERVPPTTKPGDVLVVKEGHKIAARVHKDGGPRGRPRADRPPRAVVAHPRLPRRQLG